MRYLVMYGCLQLMIGTLSAQAVGHVFTPMDDGSTVGFTIKNFGFDSHGTFKGLQGTIVYDPVDPASDSFNVSIDAGSINTDNNMRDEHLRQDAYFDVAKYPRISFVSTSVTAADKTGHGTVTGNLTIKGVTKLISFPFLATPVGNDYIFKGSFTINRRDFGVGAASTLSNQLTVSLTVLARRQ